MMNARSGLKRTLVVLALPWLAVTLAGCRSRGVSEPATVAKDRSLIPRGQVIPPAGFGVDLVRSPPGRAESFLKANQDPSVEPAAR